MGGLIATTEHSISLLNFITLTGINFKNSTNNAKDLLEIKIGQLE